MDDDKLFLSKLSQNLLEILNDEEYYDITIEVGNDPQVKIFRAHMIILYYRSSYLQRILSTNKRKNDETLTHIKLPNISPKVFQIILRYIYSGRISLKENNILDIINLLVSASELGIQELILYVQSFLIENKSNWMEQTFDLIYRTSFENDSFLDLQKYCTELISKQPEKIFNSTNFTSISEKLLISIIQNDNLQMNEIQVWENVLIWGRAQNPDLPSDIANYSKDDFIVLKNTLQQCIPFIKFYNLTTKEFVDKVLPYKKILPKDLYKDLLKVLLNYLDPNIKLNDRTKPNVTKEIINTETIDSKIITHQHVETISKWIDRLEITDELTSSYEFKLLFRGSRDGFCPKKFHEICDNQSRTVTFVKVKGNNEILGGYNPTEWMSNNSRNYNKDCFIFSFNNNIIKDCIISRVMANKEPAIFDYSSYGPLFGYNDLIIWGSNGECRSFKTCYEKPIRKGREFSIEEFEVFKVL
ncbi:unnamed protein product [Rhizophagus irregularis]|nr:unnamed protein product [Rhizophagus irregularis]